MLRSHRLLFDLTTSSNRETTYWLVLPNLFCLLSLSLLCIYAECGTARTLSISKQPIANAAAAEAADAAATSSTSSARAGVTGALCHSHGCWAAGCGLLAASCEHAVGRKRRVSACVAERRLGEVVLVEAETRR